MTSGWRLQREEGWGVCVRACHQTCDGTSTYTGCTRTGGRGKRGASVRSKEWGQQRGRTKLFHERDVVGGCERIVPAIIVDGYRPLANEC